MSKRCEIKAMRAIVGIAMAALTMASAAEAQEGGPPSEGKPGWWASQKEKAMEGSKSVWSEVKSGAKEGWREGKKEGASAWEKMGEWKDEAVEKSKEGYRSVKK